MADSPADRPVELRIHGVGGSTPEALLGERHPDDVVELERGHRTGLWARRRDPSVQGYVWGGLTAGAKLQPLWIVLLPFTLANVAGWMHPPVTADPRRRRQVHHIRVLVKVLGYTLTATWALWLAVVIADLIVYQGGREVTPLSRTGMFWGLGTGAAIFALGVLWHRWLPLLGLGVAVMAGSVAARSIDSARVRAVAGVVLAEAALVVLAVLAGVSRRRYERRLPEGVAPDPVAAGASNQDFRSPTFFARPDAGRRLLIGHGVMIAVVTVLLIVRAIDRAADGHASLDLGSALVALGAVQMVLVAVLAARSLGEWQLRRERWRFAGPAVAVGLAIILTTGVFSGLTLFTAKRVDNATTGAELALVDVFAAGALLVGAVLVFVWIPYFLSAKPPPPPPDASPEELAWQKRRFSRQRLARGIRHVDLLCTLAVAFLVVAGLVATLTRVNFSGAPWEWTIEADAGLGPLRSAASWLLPFAVPAVGGMIRVGLRGGGSRSAVGNLWDILGVWPRHFHPLAVRPYAERAIPELQDHVRSLVAGGNQAVICAHSQGSVLAFVALSGMAGEESLGRVDLVTYGSPLGRLHGRFFPGYFGRNETAWLRSQLRSWRNFFRRTDHIGQAVFEGVLDAAGDDIELPDPAQDGPATLQAVISNDERFRLPWRELAGHNDYLWEPAIQRCVREAKEAGGASRSRD